MAESRMKDSLASTGTKGVDRAFGLMRIGGALLALPVEAIREVIPGRPNYCPLPIKAEGLLGAVDIRGTIIPVLDLRYTLGLTSSLCDELVIIIMRWQNTLLGLTADEVCGIARVDGADLFALATLGASTDAALATHTFQSSGGITTVLDPGGIAALPGIPRVAEQVGGKRSGLSTATESILLFSHGRSNLGIDATCVDATVPTSRIERNALANGYCLGIIDHQGYEIPVVDTRAAIGLSATAGRIAESAVIVVRFPGEAMLGFAIDAVRDIVRVSPADILDMPHLPAEDASLFRGVLESESGQQNLLLDAGNLWAQPALLALAGFRKPRIAVRRSGLEQGARSEQGPTGSVANLQPFLTYVAGAEHTSPLGQINEILTYPADVAPFEIEGRAMLGLFTHRGKVAPLVCLSALLGRPCELDVDTARVLFVETAGRAMGFVVQSLNSIESADLRGSDGRVEDENQRIFRTLVMLGKGDQRRMVSHIDLAAEIAKFYRHPARPDMVQETAAGALRAAS